MYHADPTGVHHNVGVNTALVRAAFMHYDKGHITVKYYSMSQRDNLTTPISGKTQPNVESARFLTHLYMLIYRTAHDQRNQIIEGAE